MAAPMLTPIPPAAKPEIGRHNLDTEAVETEETVLEVVATGIPKPSIKWYALSLSDSLPLLSMCRTSP